MAETTPIKRHREEETLADEEATKRQKPSSSSSSSYNDQILCLLDDSDELNRPNNDLTSFLNALQQEISSDDKNAAVSRVSNVEDSSTSCVSWKEDDVDDENNEKVIQHLLEASDDELGIPNTGFGESNYDMIKNDINQDYVYGNSLLDGFGDAFWELEDEAANYYTLLQSELFL
ncbi:hypothetical protein BRARA_I03153 [Brassica rapa]|uniref:Uncharacterized protein n=3 Tax=Brassica TaxID=3705 RepID=A0A397XZV4_BRACM|nr:uncharacterized protein LOC103840659 [Brassica rapa]XP_013746349.1 uncharacterized protein BNAA09G29380D [Brassica napus]KAG5396036.1 hypothetical protein IGI04_017850 [Brassica rapa subsp. trilocularis]RID46497.1 hypothetical protein BRARA_I03153 [Brassica rapa]CAF2045663.1 unnamed protein product [Brassica napus]CAG7864745.1 unnamed protein product [Brassica rapa]CDY16204.1 BnaA09g29380D [Brassica napus]